MSTAEKKNWYESNKMEVMTETKVKYKAHKIELCLLYVL